MEDLEGEQLWRSASALEDKGRLNEAIALYKKAIIKKNINSMINLANIYDDKIKPSRPHEAVLLYKKAARWGSSVAAWNLYKHFSNIFDKRKSKYWLDRAASLGDEDAISILKKRK